VKKKKKVVESQVHAVVVVKHNAFMKAQNSTETKRPGKKKPRKNVVECFGPELIRQQVKRFVRKCICKKRS